MKWYAAIKTRYHQWETYKAHLKENQKAKYWVLDTLESILVAGILALIIRTYVIQTSVVPSGSMIPTLEINDRLFVNKFIYRFKQPKRGDIVVFSSPMHDGKDYVKRCIGMPGETLEMRQGIVYIDGKELVLPGINIQRDDSFFGPVYIPKGCYLMLGDNRSNSYDSRYWGFVKEEDVLGEALFTFWPFDRMRVLE